MKFKLEVINVVVQDFSVKNGAHGEWVSKGSLDVNVIIEEELNRDNIVMAIRHFMNIDIEPEMLSFYDEYGSFGIVEDKEAKQDEHGTFFAEYTFIIKPISDVINLSFLEDEI